MLFKETKFLEETQLKVVLKGHFNWVIKLKKLTIRLIKKQRKDFRIWKDLQNRRKENIMMILMAMLWVS